MPKSNSYGGRIAELVQRMRDDIRFGAYEFGAWLKLIDLQERYDANQAEMRRVLAELKVQRLVEHRANFGFRVATPNAAEQREMRQVRVVLERSTAPLIVARATAEDIAELRQLSLQFEACILEKGRRHQALANTAFHERLYRIAGNQVLIDLIHELRERSHYGGSHRWRLEEGMRASATQHDTIIDAIERRDPVELERQIAQHIEPFA